MKLRYAILMALSVGLPWGDAGVGGEADENGRYLWSTYRLRELSTAEGRLQQVRRIALLKMDTATGKIWMYSPESLTIDSEGVKGEFGHFQPIDVEGLPAVAAADPKPDGKKDGALHPAKLTPGRFGFTNIGVPREVIDMSGEKAGVVERDELFLTDRVTGINWVFTTRADTSKKDGKEIKTSIKTLFTRVFNADELVVVDGEKKDAPKEESAYKLKNGLTEWRELFMSHRDGQTLVAEGKAKVDCAIVLSKDDNISPLVVLRESLKNTKAVAVTPWQKELHSDKAVEYLCDQAPVEFDKADRYVIFINLSAKTAKGFNAVDAKAISNMPDQIRISKLIRIQ